MGKIKNRLVRICTILGNTLLCIVGSTIIWLPLWLRIVNSKQSTLDKEKIKNISVEQTRQIEYKIDSALYVIAQHYINENESKDKAANKAIGNIREQKKLYNYSFTVNKSLSPEQTIEKMRLDEIQNAITTVDNPPDDHQGTYYYYSYNDFIKILRYKPNNKEK